MKLLCVMLGLAMAAAPLAAQQQADSTIAAAYVPRRASWTSDRRSFRVGDVLTVIVDEQTQATERTARNATNQRSQGNSVALATPSGTSTSAAFQTGVDEQSRQNGQADRQGRLSATISVRVTEVLPDGSIRLSGERSVTVDRRAQKIKLTGLARPEDVDARNLLHSSRLADAAISYDGKSINPNHGIIGRIAGLLVALKIRIVILLTAALAAGAGCPRRLHAQYERVGDLVTMEGNTPRRLVGYGIVVGLNGTGDRSFGTANSPQTVQSVANLLRRFDITVPAEQLRLRNVAAVLVTAEVSPYLRSGNRFDVTVGSLGDATSLRGGVLWMTPLVADANMEPVATAQGSLVIGSDGTGRMTFRSGGSARVPEGGVMEVDAPAPVMADAPSLRLRRPGLAAAASIASAINSTFGTGTARADDPGSVRIVQRPQGAEDMTTFLAAVETLVVRTNAPARLVVDSRDGTVVMGGQISIGAAVVTHAGITLAIGDTTVARDSVTGLVRQRAGATVQDVAAALHTAGTRPQEVAAILQALRDVGALRAEVTVR